VFSPSLSHLYFRKPVTRNLVAQMLKFQEEKKKSEVQPPTNTQDSSKVWDFDSLHTIILSVESIITDKWIVAEKES